MWTQEVYPGCFYVYKKVGRRNVYVGKSTVAKVAVSGKVDPFGAYLWKHEDVKSWQAYKANQKFIHDEKIKIVPKDLEWSGPAGQAFRWKEIQLNTWCSPRDLKKRRALEHELFHLKLRVLFEDSREIGFKGDDSFRNAMQAVTTLNELYHRNLKRYAFSKDALKLKTAIFMPMRKAAFRRFNPDAMQDRFDWAACSNAHKYGFATSYGLKNADEFICDWVQKTKRPKEINQHIQAIENYIRRRKKK